MKRALLNSLEPGRICDVVDVGNEFEVAETFTWIDAPDNVTTAHILKEDGSFYLRTPLDDPNFIENGYKVARQIAYKSVGDQLDMIFKEIQSTGTLSADGAWVQHIQAVKTAIPKDDPAAVIEWNIRNSGQ